MTIHNSGEFDSISASHAGTDYIHQVLTETSFAQVDPLPNGEGFTIRSWKNLDGAPTKSGDLYETPAASAVLAEVTFQKPPSATNDHELYIFTTENFGAASSYRCVEHHVFDPSADTLIVTTYAQHNVGQADQIIKRETLDYTRTPGGKIWDYSFTRVVEEAANDAMGSIGALELSLIHI